MANVNSIYSVTVRDFAGNETATPFYFTFDDATDSYADVVADVNVLGQNLDAISDGQIVKTRLILDIALPSGIKGSPVDPSDIEKTGLFTFALASPNTKSYGQDVPAIANAVLTGNEIDLTNADVISFVNWLLGDTATITIDNNLWSTSFTAVRSALRTFRKHRRQAKRGI